MTPEQQALLDRLDREGDTPETRRALREEFGIDRKALSHRIVRARAAAARGGIGRAVERLATYGYEPAEELSPAEAWAAGKGAFERALGKAVKRSTYVIKRPAGPFAVFHCTDEHVDDDKAALAVLEKDIEAAHEMNAVMVHGGDLLNNWPLAGKLAAQWAHQECTMPHALLRARHFIEIFQPDVWVDGNHDKMNPYLSQLYDEWLPKKALRGSEVARGEWAQDFTVRAGSEEMHFRVSHKFQKGSSWFHKTHGHIREMLESEPVDVLMDGHVHSYGAHVVHVPERNLTTLCVASGGYKVMDQYAERISRGGVIPKLMGRCNFIICDPAPDGLRAVAFPEARQARAYLRGLQMEAA